ncbi:hypothetical protein AC579_6785 [Pseudocercospora musae]|uniref:Uncharacterized protein n=1 Tax=Pseudocercospora musae TaxID=113226 RepID=A0A139I3G0_9PEZI|nr:hypothetical protein AC579_6785 [Pseudocercospora musae]
MALTSYRINEFSSEPVTIIAGLAVVQSCPSRQSNRFRERTALVVGLAASPPAVKTLLYFIHALRLDYDNEDDMEDEGMRNELQVAFEI